ncbi:hypothetical protein C8J56DRAFT_1072904 [Mycena floridula]|nr:hypothetical protein C8J56DRAFT_1072904 [Mycena floridula]
MPLYMHQPAEANRLQSLGQAQALVSQDNTAHAGITGHPDHLLDTRCASSDDANAIDPSTVLFREPNNALAIARALPRPFNPFIGDENLSLDLVRVENASLGIVPRWSDQPSRSNQTSFEAPDHLAMEEAYNWTGRYASSWASREAFSGEDIPDLTVLCRNELATLLDVDNHRDMLMHMDIETVTEIIQHELQNFLLARKELRSTSVFQFCKPSLDDFPLFPRSFIEAQLAHRDPDAMDVDPVLSSALSSGARAAEMAVQVQTLYPNNQTEALDNETDDARSRKCKLTVTEKNNTQGFLNRTVSNDQSQSIFKNKKCVEQWLTSSAKERKPECWEERSSTSFDSVDTLPSLKSEPGLHFEISSMFPDRDHFSSAGSDVVYVKTLPRALLLHGDLCQQEKDYLLQVQQLPYIQSLIRCEAYRQNLDTLVVQFLEVFPKRRFWPEHIVYTSELATMLSYFLYHSCMPYLFRSYGIHAIAIMLDPSYPPTDALVFARQALEAQLEEEESRPILQSADHEAQFSTDRSGIEALSIGDSSGSDLTFSISDFSDSDVENNCHDAFSAEDEWVDLASNNGQNSCVHV